MRRLALPALAGLAAFALVALLAFGLRTTSDSTTGGAVGSRPPTASLPLLTNAATKKSLADYHGRVVVLNVFASWCPPCKQETPLLERTQRRLQQQGDATVLGVTYNDTQPDALAFTRRYGVSFPVLRAVDESFTSPLGVKGVPETFVLDRQGRIAAVRRGPVDERFLRAAIAKASAE